MDKEIRIRNIITMAQRAGKLASGSFAVEQAFQGRKVRLLLLAGDASESSRKKYISSAEKQNVPYAFCMDREHLGTYLGKDFRSAAAILDDGFAGSLIKILEEHMDR